MDKKKWVKKIVYFIIMFFLYLGNMYLVFNFLDRFNSIFVLAISLLIAIISNDFTEWLVDIIFADKQ